jgi:hypothetical protein
MTRITDGWDRKRRVQPNSAQLPSRVVRGVAVFRASASMSYSSEYAINPLRRLVITEVAAGITIIHAAASPAEPVASLSRQQSCQHLQHPIW